MLDEVDSVPQSDKKSTDFTKIAVAVEKIRSAGFTLQLQPGDKLLVTPRTKLSEAQVKWISTHKLAIIAYLRLQTAGDPALADLQAMFGAKVETITLPAPPVGSNEPEMPPEPVLVRCLDCRHGTRALPGDEIAAWRLCEAGYGGYFALKKRLCDGFAARAA